ncbi:KilA-N domain-containing protein [Cyanobium sp. Aljojuca 7D2]|uniref:KilA-N domain-containing protein n=1 Tax=Cyanobium sp. Aljojuca 7D2 TaxID=2823698 RepID=UPI0020CE7E83|nr:KilA-N domain-containing protein [Cyanobium sp. Aljojuca 7D2]MCP9891498.1 KilA-N domain-containing protein [Cyanobium sp. Aljojuca 7D2]
MNNTTTGSFPVSPLASMDHPDLVSRSWNGTPISRRTTDGYVNATAMCRANGKQWSKYRESDRCQTYLDALAETSEIRMFDLIESRQGQGGGTWVHPQVAVDLARWISAPFAVWMDGWFLESLQQAQPAPVETPPPRLREVEVIALVERSITLFEQLGGLDQRDQLLFKDIVRSNVLTASSGVLPGAPTDQELTLGDAWLEVFQQVLPRNQFCAAGKLVARAYREEFGEEPPRRQQFVDGAPCQVKSYRRSWLIDTLKRFRAQLAGG